MLKIAIVIGNRPHFIKCAPFLKALTAFDDIKPVLIHSGQHYDMNMSGIFLKDFNFPPIDINLAVGSGSSSSQTGRILCGLDEYFDKNQPDCVVSMGDTNTTLATALAAYYRHIPSAHIEAGMRENIWRPEEINKKMADHCGDFLFAPIPRAVDNLRKEGIPDTKIYLTGDITYDTFLSNKAAAAEIFAKTSRKLNIPKTYDLLTLHRAETVDVPEIFSEVLAALTSWPRPLVFPIHPRTLRQLHDMPIRNFQKSNPHIHFLQPQGYLEFLSLLLHAHTVATDSSGVLKEAFYAGKPCIVLDNTSEYQEIFDAKSAVFGGLTTSSILTALEKLDATPPTRIKHNPFGNGTAAQKMAKIIYSALS